MNISSFNTELFDFLKKAVSPFHAVQNMSQLLAAAGYIQVHENEKFPSLDSGKFYCIRDDGTLIAFFHPESSNMESGFRILGSHSDSPSLQIKPQSDISQTGFYQLAVEVYGGPLLATWFDRELSTAGRVTYLDQLGSLHRKLLDAKEPLAYIPSLAIHLDRSANSDKTIDRQKELVPVLAVQESSQFHFEEILQDLLEKAYPDEQIQHILGFDMFLYDVHQPGFCGLNQDLIVGSRLDNLLSCFVALQSLLSSADVQDTVFYCTNHEEIGSKTMSGAQSNFLSSFFERLLPDPQERYAALARSVFFSLDNAHASHPNFPERHESSHKVILNRGPVIKSNAAQRYATTSYSRALFSLLAQEAGVPIQDFVMRNDMPCGSTIGPLIASQLGISTVDIGIPTLGMHSIRELTGSKDPWLMYQVLCHFLQREFLPPLQS